MRISEGVVSNSTKIFYCITIEFKNEEPLEIFFTKEKDAKSISDWFKYKDTDCFYIEYKEERTLLLRKNIISLSPIKKHVLNNNS